MVEYEKKLIEGVWIYTFECKECGFVFSSDKLEEALIQYSVHKRTQHGLKLEE